MGCAQKNNASQISQEKMENIILYATIGDHNQKGDPITIRDVKLEGNILTLSVTYSGGCSKHVFSLIGSTNISKSLPPRRAVSLIHQAQGDQCKKAVMEDLVFDLSELAYKKENGSKIWLDIEGWKQAIDYTFTMK
jgi:hypothetical protein